MWHFKNNKNKHIYKTETNSQHRKQTCDNQRGKGTEEGQINRYYYIVYKINKQQGFTVWQ